MRKGLFLGVLLATFMVGGTALADRNDDNGGKERSRGTTIKEQVLEKQREGFGKVRSSASNSGRSNLKQDQVKEFRARPKGDVYSDQAQRSGGKSVASQVAGRNMSSSNRINTPSEIRAMMRMINPMLGAYRTSQASEGTDSYGGGTDGTSRIPNGRQSQAGNRSKNMSATGKINTPAEIKQFIAMINPMHGAYRTSQAAEGTDSYGGKSLVPYAYGDHSVTHVHFKNDRGEVINSTKGNTATAMKNREMRDNVVKMVKEKMAKAAKIEGK